MGRKGTSWEGLDRKEMSGEVWIMDRKEMSCVGLDGTEMGWEGLDRRVLRRVGFERN